MKALLREPIIQFALIGSFVWGLNHFVIKQDQLSPLKLPPMVRAELQQSFQKQNGRPPTQEELQAHLNHYFEDEILYQEAKRLHLGKGDPIVRRRLIQMMRFFVEDSAEVKEPTSAELRAWVKMRPSEFMQEATYSFSHRFFGTNQPPAEKPFIHGSIFTDVPSSKIIALFGATFAEALTTLPLGQWSQGIESTYGSHQVLLTQKTPAKQMEWSLIEPKARIRFINDNRSAALEDFINKARKQYQIR